MCKARRLMVFVFPFLSLLAAFDVLAAPLTRQELLKGAPVPERRLLPESTKTTPCENFHKYVCEVAESEFQLPADRSGWTFSFSDNHERILHAKKTLFRKLAAGFTPDGARVRPLKNFYQACMNAKASAAEELSEVRRESSRILSIKTREGLKELVQQRIDSPDFGFVGYGIFADQSDPSRSDLAIYGRVMTLPERSYYEKEAVVADLKSVIEVFFQEIKLDRPAERAQWVLEFEKEMARAWPTPAEIRNRFSADTYRPRAAFLSDYPNLKLERFLKRVPLETRVRDFAPEALKFLNGALAEMPLPKLQSVFLFHSLRGKMDDGYPVYFKKFFDLANKHLGGPAERPPRDERCTKAVMGGFSHEIDDYLTPILFPNFPRERVVALVQKVRLALVSELERNTWLSEAAKSEAKRKIESAELYLVQPQTEKEWDFKPILSYSPTARLANIRKLERAKIDKALEELKGPRPRERWGAGPLTLNAYYSGADNRFVLLQGILQPPFFSAEASELENIAAIGSVVGHELGHAIDDKGSRYDSTGRLRQWMTEKDLKAFEERAAKFVARFEAIGHNGKLTLGENIGDHVGLRAAYLAAGLNLPSASVSDKQEFFKSYARVWCGVDRPEYAAMRLKTGPHSLEWARINEQVVHLDGFYEAFSCKSSEKMYVEPRDRVRVW